MTADPHPRWPSGIGKARLPLRNNLLLQAGTLARALPTTRVSAGTFLLGEGSGRVGFATSLSTESSRSAVRVCADRGMRRSLLEAAGVPVPAATRFGFGQIEQALDRAAGLPGGVLVKPRGREEGFRRTATSDPDRLRRRITELRESLGPQETFLVEEHVQAPCYTCYVVGDDVVSVVRRDGRAWAEEIYRDGQPGGEVDSGILALARRAVAALPALPHAAVQLACPDPRSPADAVVLSVEPQISLVGRIPPRSWSIDLADRLVSHAGRHLAPSPPVTRLCADVEMTEVSRAPALVEAANDWLAERGVSASLRQSGPREVVGELTASPGQAAALSWLAARGRLGGRAPRTVTLTPRA